MDDLISRQKAKDVIDMALDSIDHVPPWVYDKLLNALNEVPSVQPTHPTPSNTLGALDCVDRQVAIDALMAFKEAHKADRFTGDFLHWTGIKAMLENLPSVQPRKGKWIIDNPHSEIYRYVCSECHAHHRARYDFCPSCGCRMEEGDAE